MLQEELLKSLLPGKLHMADSFRLIFHVFYHPVREQRHGRSHASTVSGVGDLLPHNIREKADCKDHAYEYGESESGEA